MSSAYCLCTGNVAGAVSIGKGRVLVSVQGDGVSCYDISTQKPVASWPLGGADQEFASGAVYDYATNQCFAPVRPRGAGPAAKSGSVLAWCPDESAGTITQLARPLHLPALHRVFPLSHTPEGEEEEAAAAAAEEAAGGEVDGSGQRPAGAVAVFAAGGAALCSGSEVVAEAEEARGQHTVAAAYTGGRLVVVSSEAASGAAAAAVYSAEGGQLEREARLQLAPPAPGCRAVAATSTPERTAVLWSDGTVAVYCVPGDKQPLYPLPEGDSRAPAAQRRLAGLCLPAGKQHKAGGAAASSKKRGAAAPEAAAGAAGMAALGEKQVALVGWAKSSEGSTILRLVVLETAAACVQLAQDFSAADVGLAALDPSKPIQVESLGGNRLAVAVGSAVLVVSCSDLRPPTLANLLGALAVDKALAAAKYGGADAAGGIGGGAALLAPAGGAGGGLLGSTAGAGVNPAAAAAARVLHADELAALGAPFGSAARPIEHRLVLEEPTEPGQWLVEAKEVVWRVADEAADAAIAAEERRVWQEVGQPAAPALASDAALQALLAPLLELARRSGYPLSPQLLCRLAMLAAEHERWGAVATLVSAQPPRMLGDVPGLAAAAADAGRLDTMAQLLETSADVPAAELAALLRVLLSPPSSDAAVAGRQAQHQAAQAAAQAAEAAAQRAAAAGPQAEAQPPAAQQQQQQPQQPPATASKAGKKGRGRKKGAADEDSDSDAEDLTALAPAAAEPGAANGIAQADVAAGPAAAAQQAAPAREPPGAREQAVAACCRAAVEGFEAAEVCLHPLLAVRHSAAVLLEALRRLTGPQSVALLRYLARLLRNHGALVGCAASGWQPPLATPRGGPPLPAAARALEWANCLLDASLVKLSLEPEAKPLLAELSGLVEAAVADTRPLLRVAGLVQHLLAQAALPRGTAGTADYSVQWLDLRVLPPSQRAQPQPL